MRHWRLSVFLAAFCIAGCAGHFYREEAGRVHIYLRDSRASAVHFASSLDGFDQHRIERVDSKTWHIVLPATEEFRYFYLIDGRVHLPDCPYRERDDFGTYNCLYTPEPLESGADCRDGICNDDAPRTF
jgi:hypothetical protein